MLGIAQRHRGGWRVALVPPTQFPPQSQKGGKATGHKLQRYPRCLSCSTSGTQVPNTPTSPLILLGDLEARSRGQLAGGRQGWPRVPESQPAEPPISAQDLRYPNTTQRLRLPKAPGTQESQLQRLPGTKSPQPSIPRTQAAGLSFLLLSNLGIQVLPFQGPWHLRTPKATLGPGV